MLHTDKTTVEIYREMINAQIKEMKAKMLMLEARTEKSGAQFKARYLKRMSEMKTKFDDVEKKLDQISTSTGDAWDEIRTGIDKSMSELRDGFENATKQFEN